MSVTKFEINIELKQQMCTVFIAVALIQKDPLNALKFASSGSSALP